MNKPYLKLSTVKRWEPEARRRGVSKVARSSRGFLSAYKRAGSASKLSDEWKRARHGFIARHMAQVKNRSEPLFKPNGSPTDRHLALIMWAYSPVASKLTRRRANPEAGWIEAGWIDLGAT